MKKIILFSIIIAVFLSSCKKDQKNILKSDQTKYKVNFNVSGFTQQILGSANGKTQANSLKTNASTPLDESISVLYYVVFDANKNVVSQVRQQVGAANFGYISDALAAGTYTVVFAGGDSNLKLSTSYVTTQGQPTIVPHISEGSTNTLPWGDVFFKETSITVSGGDITQDINMDRIVGKLTINIEDVLPANASSLTVTSNFEYNSYPLIDKFPETATKSVNGLSAKFTIPASAIGTSNYKVSVLMMNTVNPFNVSISCFDSANTLIAQSVVNNVTLAANAQVILSGQLFAISTGINTGLNQVWDPTPITIHF